MIMRILFSIAPLLIFALFAVKIFSSVDYPSDEFEKNITSAMERINERVAKAELSDEEARLMTQEKYIELAKTIDGQWDIHKQTVLFMSLFGFLVIAFSAARVITLEVKGDWKL